MVRRTSPWERRAEEGFTLIELMVVVVIIAILAAVLVPNFFSQGKKVKANTEVTAVFAEFAAKEERFRQENQTPLDDDGDTVNNAYHVVAACPTAPSSSEQDISGCTSSTDWVDVGISSPHSKLRCSYSVIVGDSNDDPTTTVPSGATYTVVTGTIATSWYMLHAKCDMDGNGVFSHYLSTSFDLKPQITNEGQ